MTFNSFLFLLVFLPVTLIVYWKLRSKGQFKLSLSFVILASFVFYGYTSLCGLVIFALSIGINYAIGRKLSSRKGSKALLTAGVLFDLALLSLFKYGGTFIPYIGTKVVAPGISFYTFCEIAFLVECYRESIEKISVTEYGFLMTFFPKIIQGPITRPVDILPQLSAVKSPSWEKIYRALMLFSLGCFKKVIIADNLGKAVDYGFGAITSMHTGEAIVIMVSYTLQLYFDFSGYCDMAMAIANAFGVELPLNFDSPYKAVDIDDFWKRWHISLTTFFTRYVYIPLGGNRKGNVRTYINILIIFFLSGIWHGAGWQFIIWGLLHGFAYVLIRFWYRKGRKPSENSFVIWFKRIITFIYVNIAWVFFRAPSIREALYLFKDMGQIWFPRFNQELAKRFNIDELWYIVKVLRLDRFWWGHYLLMFVILILLLVLVFKAKSAVEYSKSCKINIANTALMTILFIWCFISFEGVATYLYVNF